MKKVEEKNEDDSGAEDYEPKEKVLQYYGADKDMTLD